MSSSSRFIKNNYPDYDAQQDYLSKVNRAYLRDDVHQSITAHLARLFQYWENNLSKFDPNDISVYTGLTGAALLYLKLHESNVFTSSDCLAKCSNVVERAMRRFHKIRVTTFMCGEVGLLTVAALLKARLGQDSKDYLRRIVSVSASLCDLNLDTPDEILYGRSGYLYALLLIRSRIENSAEIVRDDLIRSIITAILNSGIQTSKQTKIKSPLVYFWYNEPYVGAAHGYAGIVYMLLEAKQFLTQDELTNLVKPTIDFVCRLQFKNTANFPACVGEKEDKLLHWCHGSPGVIHLLVLAYKTFGFEDPKYLQIAIKASDYIWAGGLLKKGYGLCHGASGNAYSFLRLFQLTQDQKYLYRAVKFAEWCCDYGNHDISRMPDTPFSLFEGLAGTLYFLADILRPFEARFPAFQLTA